ncbi:tRNA (guanine(10)-N(2))-dimethyltransferase [Candidatus Woesearchaeota archaeon]|nr:tRNA (guanine(10)-N(2))-dimethyltransferase [Candidatus Woesearchaeota archaeon]
MYEIIKEGNARIKVRKAKKISKEMEVFYNPVMAHNRDISVLLLNCIGKKDMQIGLPLAGTGIRGIRFLLELRKNKIKSISFNDISKDAVKSIKSDLLLNKTIKDKVRITNEDANLFLLNSKGFDYIDVDPFGSPNFMLDSAIRRISREGILAVTATDTAALTGTYPKVCRRKYWAEPLRNELMHEIGLRILIRKCQLIGAQYEKALIPIFSYFKNHYFRIFFKCVKGKKDADKVIEQHGFFEKAGPLWAGKLWDKKLVDCIYKLLLKNKIYDQELIKFLKIIKDESKINTVGFYDVHKLVKKHKIKKIPKKEKLIKRIKRGGFKVSETHFSGTGLRSDIPLGKLLRFVKQ